MGKDWVAECRAGEGEFEQSERRIRAVRVEKLGQERGFWRVVVEGCVRYSDEMGVSRMRNRDDRKLRLGREGRIADGKVREGEISTIT